MQNAGPLLTGLLDAQRLEAELVTWPCLEVVATALIRRASELDESLIWPVGLGAERIAGAAALLGRGDIQIGTWNTPVQGQRILLLAIAEVTPVRIEATAQQLRLRGATEVHACGVDVHGIDAAVGLDSYSTLERPLVGRRFAMLGDAA